MISLESYGIHDLAWTQEHAIKLINSLMQEDIGILGGDVYQLKVNTLQPLYDNWSCEPFPDEPISAFYLRSKQEALHYIQKYPILPEEEVIFSITFSEDLCE